MQKKSMNRPSLERPSKDKDGDQDWHAEYIAMAGVEEGRAMTSPGTRAGDSANAD